MQQLLQSASTGLAIGLMSGTSGDGIDAVLVRFTDPPSLGVSGMDVAATNVSATDGLVSVTGRRATESFIRDVIPHMELIETHYVPYSMEQREQVFRLFREDVPVRYVAHMDALMGQWFGEAALALIEKAGVRVEDVSVIGSHGQTVYHAPHAGVSLQIGHPANIAYISGCPVVSDFRRADVAKGGQGAPLVPYFDYAYFRAQDITRVVLNIGGISNITVLPTGATLDDVLAFDTGPGNMLIDALVDTLTAGTSSFDKDGLLAASGVPRVSVIEKWLANDEYLHRRPPKSTGRERYGVEFLEPYLKDMADMSMVDKVATMTRFVAHTVALGIEMVVHQPFELVIGGGGRHNVALVRSIEGLVQPVRTLSPETHGIPSDMKEAMAFALFAWQFVHGRPTNVPSATGANGPALLGQWTPSPLRCDI
jgi:anhydro-N-acetylmuramic acid kinase